MRYVFLFKNCCNAYFVTHLSKKTILEIREGEASGNLVESSISTLDFPKPEGQELNRMMRQ